MKIPDLRALLALAWIEELAARTPAPEVTTRVRLDDTGRAPIVPLQPAQRPERPVLNREQASRGRLFDE